MALSGGDGIWILLLFSDWYAWLGVEEHTNSQSHVRDREGQGVSDMNIGLSLTIYIYWAYTRYIELLNFFCPTTQLGLEERTIKTVQIWPHDEATQCVQLGQNTTPYRLYDPCTSTRIWFPIRICLFEISHRYTQCICRVLFLDQILLCLFVRPASLQYLRRSDPFM